MPQSKMAVVNAYVVFYQRRIKATVTYNFTVINNQFFFFRKTRVEVSCYLIVISKQ